MRVKLVRASKPLPQMLCVCVENQTTDVWSVGTTLPTKTKVAKHTQHTEWQARVHKTARAEARAKVAAKVTARAKVAVVSNRRQRK